MKVCMVLASQGMGGLEKHVADLANALSKRIQVAVIAPCEFGAQLEEGVDFEPVDLIRYRYNPMTLMQLARTLRSLGPDIVHAQANKAAAMVGTVRRWFPARYVATIHNIKRDTGMFKSFDHLLAVSKTVARILPDRPTTVIYNGIRYEARKLSRGHEYLAENFGLSFSGQVVVTVGRLVHAKGFDLLLKAWRQVDAQLLIVGDGPEKEKLLDLAHEHGVAERVHFLGFRTDVIDIMAASDLYVMSSRREGFGIVLIEALHAGLPIVATAVPVACEILPEDVLVPVDDPVALAQTVNRLLAWPKAKRMDHFRNCVRMAREELTLDRMAQKTLELYQEVLDGR
jgi:glycosyltransferase involved in cell wall biosynthesis